MQVGKSRAVPKRCCRFLLELASQQPFVSNGRCIKRKWRQDKRGMGDRAGGLPHQPEYLRRERRRFKQGEGGELSPSGGIAPEHSVSCFFFGGAAVQLPEPGSRAGPGTGLRILIAKSAL